MRDLNDLKLEIQEQSNTSQVWLEAVKLVVYEKVKYCTVQELLYHINKKLPKGLKLFNSIFEVNGASFEVLKNHAYGEEITEIIFDAYLITKQENIDKFLSAVKFAEIQKYQFLLSAKYKEYSKNGDTAVVAGFSNLAAPVEAQQELTPKQLKEEKIERTRLIISTPTSVAIPTTSEEELERNAMAKIHEEEMNIDFEFISIKKLPNGE